MAVYVDRGAIPYRGMKMCHMLADTEQELHRMAERLGIKRAWFQDHAMPHYDICQAKRRLALSFGALPIGRREVGALIKRWRQRGKARERSTHARE